MLTDSEILAAVGKHGSQRKAASALGLNHRTVERRLARIRESSMRGIRTLVIDIETRPALVYTFGMHKTSIGPNQVKAWGGVLCFAARWADEDDVIFRSEWEHGSEGMLKSAHRLLDEADEVVGWNSRRFDVGWFDSEFDRLGWRVVTPFRNVDLMRIKKARQPSFPSFKLDSDQRWLGEDGKLATGGFDLWRAVIEPGYAKQVGMTQAEARAKMREYNIVDTNITYARYVRMLWRGMLKGAHNAALGNGHVCTNCGSDKLQAVKDYRTDLSAFRAWLCQDCGTVSRETRRRPDVRAPLKAVA